MKTRNFTSQDAALTVNYIGFVLRSLVAEGYDSASLLQETGLTEDDLVNPDFRCTFEQHRAFVLNATRVTANPHLGLHMGARFNPLSMGLPATAAMSSDIFSSALDVLRRFISLNFSIVSFDFYQEGEQLIVRWEPALDAGDIAYFVLGSSLMVGENFFKLLLNEERVTDRAELALPEPPGWEAERDIPGFPVYFDAPVNKVVLPKRFLDRPLAANDPLVHQNMLRLCEKQLEDTFYDEGIESQLRRFIAEQHFRGVPIEQAAKALGFSERSLRRQLSESGSSYKKIVDDIRQSRARELLAVSGLPITTIAYDLGFSDPSNFARTFKRWVGVSPHEYRENLISGRN